MGNLELEGLGSLILKSKFEKLLIQHGSLDTGNIMYEVRDPWTAEEWQQWEAERRKAKRREAVGPYAVADGAAAPEDAADGAARAIAIP